MLQIQCMCLFGLHRYRFNFSKAIKHFTISPFVHINIITFKNQKVNSNYNNKNDSFVTEKNIIRRFFSTNNETKTPTITTVTLETFKDLTNPIRRFVLLIHPDVLHQFGPVISNTNATTLQEIFVLLDSIRNAYNADENGKNQTITTSRPISTSTTVNFFVRKESSTNDDISISSLVERKSIDLRIAPSLLTLASKFDTNDNRIVAQAYYLEIGRSIVQTLLDVVNIPIKLILAPNVVEHIAPVKTNVKVDFNKSVAETSTFTRRKSFEMDSTLSMDIHLREMSPLEQGKSDFTGSMNILQKDIFSKKERKYFSLRILARQNAIIFSSTLDSVQIAKDINRLRRIFEYFCEDLRTYEPMWLSVTIHFLETNHCDISSNIAERTLILPLNFDETIFLTHCRDIFVPALLHNVRINVRKAAEEERKRRTRQQEKEQSDIRKDKKRNSYGIDKEEESILSTWMKNKSSSEHTNTASTTTRKI